MQLKFQKFVDVTLAKIAFFVEIQEFQDTDGDLLKIDLIGAYICFVGLHKFARSAFSTQGFVE